MMMYMQLKYTRNKITIKSNCQHLIHFELQLLVHYRFSLVKFCRLQFKKTCSCWPWQLVWSTKTVSFDNELKFHLQAV